jgi:hypothetical protein
VQELLLKVHVIPELSLLATLAVNFCVPPSPTVAVFGETVTATAGGAVIVTVALAVLVESAWDVAVIVTVAGLGTVPGAVYKPFASMLPQLVPEHPLPVTVQVTAVSFVFDTVAVNCCVEET